jgi:hypothetical protein
MTNAHNIFSHGEYLTKYKENNFMALYSVARRRVFVLPCILLPRWSKFQLVFQFVFFGAATHGHLNPVDRGELRETISMLSI